ncbi:hypothetical protein LR69_00496 [Geobacillus sp. BCO2]|nr:hypothetical protein LR69_00496 [Geobacillus sp. BCO2]
MMEAWRSFLWVAGHIVLIYMVIVLLFYAFFACCLVHPFAQGSSS